MFQSKSYIERRHGKNGTDRAYYLGQLVNEYNTTENKEAKQQILANLANFAYDPINYNTLWDLSVAQLFLEAVEDGDPVLQEFGLGGLANICIEPRHHEYIMSQPVWRNNIVACLDISRPLNIKLNAMTILMQLVTAETYKTVLTAELKDKLLEIQADSKDKQASTMASLFLSDYYHHYHQPAQH